MDDLINQKIEKLSLYQLFVFICCWLCGTFGGMSANLFSLMLPEALSELAGTADRDFISQIGSYILSLFLLGWMCGGILFGFIGDRFGRVKAMGIAICCYTISTGLIALTTTYWHLFLCRFLTGLGVGGAMLTLSILLSETWPIRFRAVAIGAGITSYQAGVFLSGFIAQLFSEWRLVFGLGIFPLFLALLVTCTLHEPFSWKKAHSSSACSKSPWSTFLAHLRATFHADYRLSLMLGSTVFGGLLIGYWASLSWVPVWIQELTGSSSGQEKNIATMYHAAAAVTGCLIAGYLADRWGRVNTILFSFTGAFLVSAWMFLSNASFGVIIYFQHGILGLFAGLAQAIMYIYLPELFPAQIRATAVGFCLNGGRLVTSILVVFVGILVKFFGGYAYTLFVFSLVYLIGATAVLWMPKKCSLDNT